MRISEIYDKYNIMPPLKLHMLRVAGVASMIADNFNGVSVNKDLIMSSALLHDLGNMAKIKLDRFPEFIKPEEKDRWEKILDEFKQKYGDNDYTATYAILEELGVQKDIFDLIQSLEFAKSPQTAKSKNIELKICLYSDARVSPFGIVSLSERIAEVKERYIKNKGVSEEKFDRISKSLFVIEEQLFRNCKIKPEDITEEIVRDKFSVLKNYEVAAKILL